MSRLLNKLPSEILDTTLDDFFLNIEIISATIEHEEEQQTTKGQIQSRRGWLNQYSEQIRQRKKM